MENGEGVKVQNYPTRGVERYTQTFLLHFSFTILTRFMKMWY